MIDVIDRDDGEGLILTIDGQEDTYLSWDEAIDLYEVLGNWLYWNDSEGAHGIGVDDDDTE